MSRVASLDDTKNYQPRETLMKSLYRSSTLSSSTLTYASVLTLSLATAAFQMPTLSWSTLEKVAQAFVAFFTPELVFQHAPQTTGTGSMPTKSQTTLQVNPQIAYAIPQEKQKVFQDTLEALRPLKNYALTAQSTPFQDTPNLDFSLKSQRDSLSASGPQALHLFQESLETKMTLSAPQATLLNGDAWENSSTLPPQNTEATQDPQEVFMRPWRTYNIQGQLGRVQNWIKVLAPETPVNIHEIPFRESLIKTILSPKFKYRIASNFWTSTENAQERGIFLRAYVDDIDWSKTQYPNGLMGSPGVDGACHLNEAALDEALRLPQRYKILQDCDDCWGL